MSITHPQHFSGMTAANLSIPSLDCRFVNFDSLGDGSKFAAQVEFH